jgi:hypothetical protein
MKEQNSCVVRNHFLEGQMQNFGQEGQLSDCNTLSGLNSLLNRVLNKKLII